VCESLYEHFQLPDGRLVHYYHCDDMKERVMVSAGTYLSSCSNHRSVVVAGFDQNRCCLQGVDIHTPDQPATLAQVLLDALPQRPPVAVPDMSSESVPVFTPPLMQPLVVPRTSWDELELAAREVRTRVKQR